MKNTTASNVAVSLAGALAEVVGDYEGQLIQTRQHVEALGQQLKRLTEEREKAVLAASFANEVVLTRLDQVVRHARAVKAERAPPPAETIDDLEEEQVWLKALANQLMQFPWPILNPTTNPTG